MLCIRVDRGRSVDPGATGAYGNTILVSLEEVDRTPFYLKAIKTNVWVGTGHLTASGGNIHFSECL